jgi:hypothetical protein
MRRFCFLVAGFTAILLPVLLIAQIPNESLINGILAARKAEAALLQKYNWNSRIEVLQDGKTEDIRIDVVTVGPTGQINRAVLNDQPGKLPDGFLRKAAAQKQREELETTINEIGKLVEQYMLPTSGKVVAFLASAKVQPVTTPDGKTLLQVSGSDVVSAGDTFAMSVDGRTLLPTGVQISTLYKGDKVTVTATFQAMKAGPNHMQYATVTVPAKKITVNIQNFDFTPND